MPSFRAALFAGLMAIGPAMLVSTPASSADPGYFDRYTGSWTGGGMVKLEKFANPFNVDCKTTGRPIASDGFTLEGSCTALLVMSKDIAARLKRDPSGVYTGVYTGSSSGPAKLRGRLQGDTLVLKVTWGRVIYDDNVAQMLISNRGNGKFTLKVIEKINGRSVTVSDLDFTKA